MAFALHPHGPVDRPALAFERIIRGDACYLLDFVQRWLYTFRSKRSMWLGIGRQITIRNQPHTVADALMRALAHAAYHVGQIVQLSRFLAKDRWTTLTIPRGGSRGFNETMREQFGK